MLNDLEEIPYYELVNRLMCCTKKLRQCNREELGSLEEMKSRLEQEQQRRISGLLSRAIR